MSLHYLLDGYNIIHQIPSLIALDKLEDRRNGLVRFIERNKFRGSVNNKITVVFDGKFGHWGNESTPYVKVIFSKHWTCITILVHLICFFRFPPPNR